MPSQGRPPQPARYDGQVDRDELTLTVPLSGVALAFSEIEEWTLYQ